MTQPKLFDIFEEYYTDVPDCVSPAVNHYENVIKNIFKLTQGILHLSKFKGIENDSREYFLYLTINSVDYTFKFIGSDFFELNLLEEFNKIIRNEKPNERRKLVDFSGKDFDFGILFIDTATELMLVEKSKIWRSEEWLISMKNIIAFENVISENINLQTKKFIGIFKENKSDFYNLFNLTIYEMDADNNFSGSISENEKIDLDEKEIKVIGNIKGDKIQFDKIYADPADLINKLLGLENKFSSTLESRTIFYEGVENGNYYFGKWKKNKNYIVANGTKIEEEESEGIWQMKPI
jgi:hypothetical protein